jgi:hypothetical protein
MTSEKPRERTVHRIQTSGTTARKKATQTAIVTIRSVTTRRLLMLMTSEPGGGVGRVPDSVEATVLISVKAFLRSMTTRATALTRR